MYFYEYLQKETFISLLNFIIVAVKIIYHDILNVDNFFVDLETEFLYWLFCVGSTLPLKNKNIYRLVQMLKGIYIEFWEYFQNNEKYT